MNGIDGDTVFRTFDSATQSAGEADYHILGFLPEAWGGCSYLAISRQGWRALIIPVRNVAADNVRLTHGLAFRSLVAVELSNGEERWIRPAAVLECRDSNLGRTFAAMVAAFAGRVAQNRAPTLEFVSSLMTEWEDLLSRRGLLSAEAEVGLWAELWFLLRTKKVAELLDGWRGPESANVDFLLDGKAFEIKASHRAGVHMVAQEQVEASLGRAETFLVSMHVAIDPVHGRSLSDLVAQVAAAAPDVAQFEEKLATVGYSRDDQQAYTRRYVLLSSPAFYRTQDVPRVRLVDPGVSQIRFRVELSPDAALAELEACNLGSILGVDLLPLEYPCV